eukprot:445335_1
MPKQNREMDLSVHINTLNGGKFINKPTTKMRIVPDKNKKLTNKLLNKQRKSKRKKSKKIGAPTTPHTALQSIVFSKLNLKMSQSLIIIIFHKIEINYNLSHQRIIRLLRKYNNKNNKKMSELVGKHMITLMNEGVVNGKGLWRIYHELQDRNTFLPEIKSNLSQDYKRLFAADDNDIEEEIPTTMTSTFTESKGLTTSVLSFLEM